MKQIAGIPLVLVLVAVTTGCPGGSSSDPDAGPTVVALRISPESADIGVLDLGDEVVLTAAATYSDGSSVLAPAAWASSGPEVTLDAADGTSVTGTAAKGGLALVTASFGGMSAQISLLVREVTSLSVAPATSQ